MQITEGKRSLVFAVCLAVILLAAVNLFRSCRAPATGVRTDFYTEFGRRAGVEVAELIGEGEVVVVRLPLRTSPPLEILTTALTKALADEGLRVGVPEVVQVADAGELDSMLQSGSFPAEEYQRIRETHPGAAGIVSLAGAPRLTGPALQEALEAPTRLVVCSLAPEVWNLEGLLEAGALSLAIVRRTGTSGGTTFEDRYEVLSGRAWNRSAGGMAW